MKYIVLPKLSRSGSVHAACKSLEQALSEKKKLEVMTGFAWDVISVQ